ncbi:DUF2523 family protein [Thiobacillus denitrificans]|uniref:DUF2523 family protein n=1 Tax=Thiobacillus denitrificans TaxID=36861 RepID=UPI0003645E4C|nr:DUF2523 family protein [Thiobacillus denitrificans]
MANFFAFLLASALPLARRVFVALGLSVVTYTGLSLILQQITDHIISSVGGLAAAGAQLAALFGFQQLVGIILAAITTKLAMTQLTAWSKS